MYFYTLFYTMEESEILDPNSEIDIYLLQLLYIPQINHQNKTPMQMWITGIVESFCDDDDNVAMEELNTYGIDWSGPVPFEDQSVIVPECTIDPAIAEAIEDFIAHNSSYSEDETETLCTYITLRDLVTEL